MAVIFQAEALPVDCGIPHRAAKPALGLAMRAAEAAWIAQGFPSEQVALEKIADVAAKSPAQK